MGFFSKIFGSLNEPTPKSDFEIRQDFYTNKYKKMESEGKFIDWSIVNSTSNGEYPYPCATEAEKEMMDDGKKPLKAGFVPAIVSSFMYYGDNLYENLDTDIRVYQDSDKVAFWKKYLVDSARENNRWCQAVLVVAENGKYYSDYWCTQEENKQWQALYKENLEADAVKGVPEAALAVANTGLCGTANDEKAKARFYQLAGEAGLGDAFFLLAEQYKMTIYQETKKVFTWGDEDCCAYYYLIGEAAKTDNGETVGWCQNEIGCLLMNGECGFEKNLKSAKLLFEYALKNNCSKAQYNYDRLVQMGY